MNVMGLMSRSGAKVMDCPGAGGGNARYAVKMLSESHARESSSSVGTVFAVVFASREAVSMGEPKPTRPGSPVALPLSKESRRPISGETASAASAFFVDASSSASPSPPSPSESSSESSSSTIICSTHARMRSSLSIPSMACNTSKCSEKKGDLLRKQ